MKEVYKIRNAYVTAIVTSMETDFISGQTFYILSDGTIIPAYAFERLYKLVDGTIGEPDTNPVDRD